MHENDLVCHVAGKTHLMGDDDLCHAFTVEIAHDLENLVNQTRIERGRRLIVKHHPGRHGQSTGDCRALLLPA